MKTNRTDNPIRRKPERALALATATATAYTLLSSSCITINHKTKEPIKLAPVTVNLKMEVDVVYHSGDKSAEEKKAEKEVKETAERQRNRFQEIKDLKDSGIIGETRDGLVAIVPDKYNSRSDDVKKKYKDLDDYIEKTVREENEDREVLMAATDRNDPLRNIGGIRNEQWARRAQSAYEHQWLKVSDAKWENGTVKVAAAR